MMLLLHCGGIHQLLEHPLQSSHSQRTTCFTGSFCGCHGELGVWTSSVHDAANDLLCKKEEKRYVQSRFTLITDLVAFMML